MRIISCYEKNKGAWTKQEDDKLINHIKLHGGGCWRTLAKAAGLERCGKSCRLRWTNYLRPDIKRGNFCVDEEELIIKLHALLGNRWSLIAGRLPGRTGNEVKNYWNTHIRRKLENMGIDPTNHRVNQTLTPSYTVNTCKNHQPNNYISRKDSEHLLKSKSLSNDYDQDHSDSEYFIGSSSDVSSSELNLDLTIAFPSSSSSHSSFPVVKKKKDASDELIKADIIEAQNNEKPTLLLFR